MSKRYIIPAAIRGRYAGGGKIIQRLEVRPNMCTNTLTGVQKDNVLIEIDESEEANVKIVCERRCDEGVRFFKDNVCGTIRTIDGGGDKRVIESNPINLGNVNPSGHGMNGSVYDSCGVCPTLTTNKGEGTKVKTHFRVRKLTQKECWRLMGFSDEDFYKAQAAMNQNLYGGKDRSGSQLYKQAGNSIVVDVLCAIMKELYEAMPYLFDDMAVGSFFSGIGAFEKALTKLDTHKSAEPPSPIWEEPDLQQIGYINDYNGDANRVYNGDGISRTLKADAGGGVQKQDGTK